MSKGKRIMLWVTMTVIAIGAIAIKHNLSAKKQYAVQIAKEYLAQKYSQEMKFETVRFSWVDPSLYHVSFISTDTDVKFEVSVWSKALAFPKGTNDYGDNVADDYVKEFFCQKTEEIILPEMRTIWDENMNLFVILDSSNQYPKRCKEIANEQMTAIEMEPLYNYNFFVKTNCILNNDLKDEEAKRMLNMIQYIQTSPYSPREILFWYQTGEIDKGKKLKNISSL